MEPIEYEVALPLRVQHLVDVRVTVPADLAPGAVLTFPTWTPGSYVERDYVHHLQHIAVTDVAGDPVQLTPQGHTAWALPEDVVGPVTVELEWYANDLTVRTNHVDDHHALLVAPATFPFVAGAEDRPARVTVVPTDGHRVWGLLPTEDGGPDGRATATTYRADDLLHLVDSAFEVGDLPSASFDVDGVPHHWVHASHGGSIDLERIRADVTAISQQARAVFDDELPIESYTFLCVGADDEAGGGGLEHRDGSVLMLPALTDATDQGVDRTRSLIAHEYLHLWNVKRLVPEEFTALTLDRPTHTTALWVAEGWTSYYDDLLPTRAGLRTPRAYLDKLRDALAWVERTPGVRRQSLTASSWHAWTGLYVRDENSVNAGTNYYTHGSVVAACLDLLIRAEAPDGDGLDEAFRLLWRRFGHREPRGYPSKGYSHDDVVDALSDAAGRDLSAFVHEHVRGHAVPPLGDLADAVGLRLDRSPPESATVDLGAQTREDDDGVELPAVFRDRPAWRAGLTGGDRLVAMDGTLLRRRSLERVLAGHRPGDVVEVAVERGSRLLRFDVELGPPLDDLSLVPVDEPTEAQATAFARWTGQPLSEL